MQSERLKVGVGIATAGRREVVSETINLLARQIRLPESLILCPASCEDLDQTSLDNFPVPTLVVSGAKGLTAQRNQILAAAVNLDVIVFFDDDFFPSPDYLAQVERLFQRYPELVGTTGFPVMDGANGPGFSIQEGLSKFAAIAQPPRTDEVISDIDGTYGCNMAFRLDPIRKHHIQFDEDLPLYGWQEDIDFSCQIYARGRILQSDFLRGIHLGTKRGRQSGVRFGYSQIANPVYLIRKGTMRSSYAKSIMWRNVAANILRSFWSEPWIDRRGRLKGNILALVDVVTGRLSPRRILDMK
jgi:glycosyltransferase involved in cell wall biosynthesis